MPASRWRPSPREYPKHLPEPRYPNHFRTLYVNTQGTLYIDGELKFLSSALAGERIGMEEADDGIWTVWFCKERIARYDERAKQLQR